MKKTPLTIQGQRSEHDGETEAARTAREKNEAIQKQIAEGSNADSPLSVREKIVNAIKTVQDPEIPVDIYELGLIYDIKIEDDGRVDIKMTLTSPACPVAQELPLEVQSKVGRIAEVTFVYVDIVWDPPWSPDKMSEEARLILGM